jgi:hypothetical protein
MLKGSQTQKNCFLGVRRVWCKLGGNNRNNPLPVMGPLSFVGTCENHVKNSLNFYFTVAQEMGIISPISVNWEKEKLSNWSETTD